MTIRGFVWISLVLLTVERAQTKVNDFCVGKTGKVLQILRDKAWDEKAQDGSNQISCDFIPSPDRLSFIKIIFD